MTSNQNDFDKLINNVYQTHRLFQLNVQKTVNQNLTIRNCFIGCYIVESGQDGEDRVKYATTGMDNQLFVSEFLVKLPGKQMLEEFIRRELS